LPLHIALGIVPHVSGVRQFGRSRGPPGLDVGYADLRPVALATRYIDAALRHHQVRACQLEMRVRLGRVEAAQDVAGMDFRVVIHQQGLEQAHRTGADGHHVLGIESARCAHGAGHGTTVDGRQAVPGRGRP
jgi:hypothetical protein